MTMGHISRRDLLKAGAVGAAGLASLPLLAACGDDDGNTAKSDDPNELKPFEASTRRTTTRLPERIAWASTADSAVPSIDWALEELMPDTE